MRIATFLSAASVVLTATMTLAQNVTYDFDRATDFSRLTTFAWVRGPIGLDQINHRRVVDAVSSQLRSKGLVRVDAAGRPDLLVAYHLTFDSDVRVTGFSSGWGPYRFAGASGVARADEIVTGTLVVDLVNTRTNTIVWRGIASREVDAKADPGKRERNINRAAERLFKNYPPAK